MRQGTCRVLQMIPELEHDYISYTLENDSNVPYLPLTESLQYVHFKLFIVRGAQTFKFH